MDTSGINLKDEQRDYEKFFLIRNPFPSLAVPDEIPPFTADREEPIRRFKDVIVELTRNDSTSVSVIVGEYGSGKSHLFRVFKHEVNRQLLSTNDGTLATIIGSPGNNFADLFFSFLDDIGRNALTQYSSQIISNYIKNNKDNVKQYISNYDPRNKFLNDNLSLEDFLLNSTYININKEIRKNKLNHVKDDDIVFAFLSLSHPEYGSIAWKWFQGSNISKSEMAHINVGKIIKEPELAFSLFDDFIKIIYFVGIKSLVILVDELEKITFLTKTSRTEYQDMLRHWIDTYPKNVCFYFSIAPHQWDNLVKEPTALVRRLSGNWHVLKPFEDEEVKELIEKYLHWSRIDNFKSKDAKNKFPNCEPSLVPFTTKSIDQIQKISDGNVSNILLLCRQCLEILYDDDKFDVITSELVNTLSKQEGLD